MSEDLTVFCQDVDALTASWRYARRFSFTPPAVGTSVVLIHAGNPLVVRIIAVNNEEVAGVIRHVTPGVVLPVGAHLRGKYGQNGCEWYYDTPETIIALEDYRQVIVDQVKHSKWLYRLSGLHHSVKCNNASTNLFLKHTTGQTPLTQTCTLLDTLTWSKKKGETFYLSLLGFNLMLFLLIALPLDATWLSVLINGGCTLYALYNWYNDVLLQRKMQKKFNHYWPTCQQEYQKLRDMIDRYGLSPNRINALKKWTLMTMSQLDYNLMPDLEALPKAWTVIMLQHISQLDMEDSATEQDTKLTTLWALMDTYSTEIARFQTTAK